MAFTTAQSIKLQGVEFEVVSHGMDNFGEGLQWSLQERMNDLITMIVLTKLDAHDVLPHSFGSWLAEWLTTEISVRVDVRSVEMVRNYMTAPVWDKYQLQIRYIVHNADMGDVSGTRVMYETVFSSTKL